MVIVVAGHPGGTEEEDTHMTQAFLTQPGAERFHVLASAEQTGGAFGLVAARLTPEDGPPPHVHHGEDETFLVLDGLLRFRVGAEEFEAGAGALVFAPRDIPHCFTVESDTARILTMVTPGGLERFFSTLAHAADPDMGLMLSLAAEHRFEILTPPLHG
jgi:quercetin dioxygenase-like cupin family protein